MKRRRGQKCAPRRTIERLEDRILLAADDTLATATLETLTPGATKSIAAQIDPAGDVDLYKVKLGFGDSLTAQITAASIGSPLNSYLRVFNSAGAELTSNDDTPTGTDSKLKFTSQAAGFYFVGVSENSNVFYNPNVAGSGSGSTTGDYTLSLTKVLFADAGDTLAAAGGISFIRGTGTAVHGEIATGLDVDLYSVNLVRGDTLNLGIDAQSQGSTLAARLRLFDAAGNQLQSAANSGGDPDLVFAVATTGTYYVGVSGAGNAAYNPHAAGSGTADSTGDFQLNVVVQAAPSMIVEAEPNGSINTPNVIDVNTTVAGTIGGPADADYYMVTVNDAGQFTARVKPSAGSHLDARLTLLGYDRQVYSTSDDQALGNPNPLIVQHLVPGTYFLKLEASGASSGTSAAGAYQLTTQLTVASSPFAPHGTGFSPTGIATGDFNGDGILDLATANQFGGVSILLGLGDLSYRPATSVNAGSQPAAVVARDFNGDHKTDLAVANAGGSSISILLGNGDGTFAPQVVIGVGSHPLALSIGDFNHDLQLDLAVANSGDGTVSILFGHANGTFTPGGTLAVGDAPADIAVADFNGDHRDDVAVANRQSGDVSILLNDGSGGFLPEQRFAVGSEPTSIAAARLNADGFMDLAVANAASDDVSLLLGHGDGSFSAEVRIDVRDAPALQSSGDFRSFVAVADFNQDGIADLVVGHSQDSRISVALGIGNGTFKRRQEFDSGDTQTRPWAVTVADLNGDGRADFATTDGAINHLSVFGGLNDGTFYSGPRLNVGNDPRSLVAADLNHDGRADLVSGANAGDSLVMLGHGNGSFDGGLQADTGHSNALAVGDFNRDGRADLVSVNFFFDSNTSQIFNQIVVLLGLGDGTYAPLSPIDAGLFLSAVVVGDFNGDGKQDLAVTSEFQSSVLVLLGSGDGTFAAPVSFAVGSLPTAIVSGDFNHDGKIDLATANSDSNDVSILLGVGGGNFNVQPPLAAGDTPSGLAVADFNGDGIDDLAVANSGNGTVTLLVGASNGDFASANSVARSFTVGDSPKAIVAGDFNGDHLADLATANEDSNDVSVLLNSGNGQFAPQSRFSVAGPLKTDVRPSALAVADFNGDGVLDLATSNNGRRNVSILSGRGDGTFAKPGEQASAGFHPSPVLVDLNGDGVADSVVLDRAGNVLLRLGRKDINGTFEAPRIINPGSPASSFTVLKDRQTSVLAVADRAATVNAQGNQHFVTLYHIGKKGAPTVVSKIDVGEQFNQITAAKLNADNRDDLVAVDSTTGTLALFLRAGTGFNLGSAVRMPVAAAPSDLLTAELNSPSGLGILIADQATGTMNIVLGGFSNPQPAVKYRTGTGPTGLAQAGETGAPGTPLVFDGATSLAVGDFNEDQVQDVIAAQSGTNSLGLMLGKGSGAFANPVGILAGSRPTSVRVADFNGDHHQDLAVLNEGTHDVSILLGDGHGHFTLLGSFDAGNSPVGLTIADVNGDKKLDLMVGNELGDVTNLIGNGNGTFQPFTRINRNMAIAVGDLNGDGKQDWVVTNSTSDRISVQSDQTAAFGRTDGVTAPASVKLADLDGDGIADMIVANSGGNNVLVYRGLGGGQFAAANNFSAGSNPVEVQIADVGGVDANGHFIGPDGLMDVVVTNFGSNDVSILLNSGDHSSGGAKQLTPGVRLNVGQGPVSTQIVQVPGQANPSLLVTNSVSNQVMMLGGLGNGFFNDVTPTVFNTGRGPTQTLVGNFDGRGLGFVTLNYNSNSLSFYSGFDPASRHDMSSGGENPLTAIAADMNADGITDLVVGNNGNGVFSVFDGGQTGLSLLNAFVSDNIDHPAAMALAQLGQGQELQLLALDEGDELVHVFSRDTLEGTTNAGLLAALAQNSTSVASGLFGSTSSGLGIFVSLVAALGVSVEGFFQDTANTSGLGGGAEGNRAFSEFFEHLGEAVDHSKHWFESTISAVGTAIGLQIDEQAIVAAVEEVVSLLFPHVPLQAVPALFHGLLSGDVGAKSATPTSIDQAFESDRVAPWSPDTSNAVHRIEQSENSIPSAKIEIESAASQARKANVPHFAIDAEAEPGLHAISASNVDRIVWEDEKIESDWSSRTVVQPQQTDQDANHHHRRLTTLATVMASLGAGGYVYRLRRRRENA